MTRKHQLVDKTVAAVMEIRPLQTVEAVTETQRYLLIRFTKAVQQRV